MTLNLHPCIEALARENSAAPLVTVAEAAPPPSPLRAQSEQSSDDAEDQEEDWEMV